jgi:hypothetical protein
MSCIIIIYNGGTVIDGAGDGKGPSAGEREIVHEKITGLWLSASRLGDIGIRY